ncbi:radical SAM protein [Photobacterium sp. GJ3]|uniref:radical SAM protein n=1 Tax=Photobacterium sp. GJ3 TaxID=2829502 RepID=UPI001B8B7EB1|nr:radical SAM protein [Photobacterium sp. GJ3]QUJ67897.1 radical SAM protein [Photobacterium sp. GJ3]
MHLKRLDIIVKVASRCNLDCTYCHWFRDPEVLRLPKTLSPALEEMLFEKLAALIASHQLEHLNLILHGGEPLLFGYRRLAAFLQKAQQLATRSGCRIRCNITTNGVLLNDRLLSLFRQFQVGIAISVDGPKSVHDKYRITVNGKGSYDKVIEAIDRCRSAGIEPALLCVADPSASGKALVKFFADELGSKRFDFLIPNFTRDDEGVASIAQFHIEAFETWFHHYWPKGVVIRHLEGMVEGLLGLTPQIETFGTSNVAAVVIQPDGAIEPHDVLRICGHDAVDTGLNLMDDAIEAIFQHPLWLTPFQAKRHLPENCRQCEFSASCAGGYVMHRYSKTNGFHNSSLYCEDIQQISRHIYDTLLSSMYVEVEG